MYLRSAKPLGTPQVSHFPISVIVVFNSNILRLDANTEFAYLASIEPTPYDDMNRFVEAMQCLAFSEKQQNLIFNVIASILHGGNIEFVKLDDEKCCISDDSEYHLQVFCQLLG